MPTTIKELFSATIKNEASDLHLIAGLPPLIRIHGELKPIPKTAELSGKDIETIVFAFLSKEDREKFIQEKELDRSWGENSDARFRVNLHWEKGNISLAARLIPEKIPTIEELSLPKIVTDLLAMPHGLILVTGPTGSGKSTSLAAMIDHLNESEPDNIITLEDPIEFVFTSKKSAVRQRELGNDMVTFAAAMKHILRQDPDVIMVGELRDLETIATTLTLAETGHLVFGTLHTINAAQTIERVIDVFPPHQQAQIQVQLATTLRGVVSQQLLPKVGGGRVAAREILTNTPAVANLIRENKVSQIKNVIQTSAKEGMFTLAQDLKRLIKEGLITKEVAQSYIIGKELDLA